MEALESELGSSAPHAIVLPTILYGTQTEHVKELQRSLHINPY